MKKSWSILLLAMVVTLSACNAGAPKKEKLQSSETPGNTQTSGKPIKIGYITPLTGRAASYGQLQKIAIDMAVEEVNKNGGINGVPLEVLTEDDQFDPQQSVTQYRKLAGENVFAILGPYSGSSWEVVSPIANQVKIPTINMNALKTGITKLPWALRIYPSDDKLIPAAVKLFRKQYPNVNKVVVIGDIKESSAAAAMEEYKKTISAEGLKLLDTIGFQTGANDFSPIVTKIKSLNPDAIFDGSLVAESLNLAKELERQGLDTPVLVNGMTWSGAFPMTVGSAGKNWHAIGFFTNEPDPSNEKAVTFAKNFLDRAKTNSTIPQPANIASTALAYDAVMMLTDILKKENVKSDSPLEATREKIQKQLVEIKDYQGVNKFTMLPNGDGSIPARLLKLDVNKKIWVEMK